MRMKKKDILAVRDSKIVKSNDLIQKSRFNLSLEEQRIVLYLLAQVNPYDDDFKEYTITLREFCTICGIVQNGKGARKHIKNSVYTLAQKAIWIELPNNVETLVRWVEKPYIDNKNGIIRIRLDKDLKPYLLRLKSNFTEYELIYTLAFKSKYSHRLYELITSVHYDKTKDYEYTWPVDELKKRLDAENYKSFGAFHQRVLRPAIYEIREYSDKIITYELIKSGKTITHVRFYIKIKGAFDRLLLTTQINTEILGLDPNQTTLYDFLPDKDK